MNYLEIFALYNAAFITLLLVNFAIIYIGINKYQLNTKAWQRYHAIFDKLDIIYNYHLAVYFLDFSLNREMISDRIRRYLKVDKCTINYKLASVVAKVINVFDKDHCKK